MRVEAASLSPRVFSASFIGSRQNRIALPVGIGADLPGSGSLATRGLETAISRSVLHRHIIAERLRPARRNGNRLEAEMQAELHLAHRHLNRRDLARSACVNRIAWEAEIRVIENVEGVGAQIE